MAGESNIIRIGNSQTATYLTGNVGIGTTTPGAKLEISNGTTCLKVIPGQLNGVASPGSVTLEIPGGNTLGIWDSLLVNNNLTVAGNSILQGYVAINIGLQNVALTVKKAVSNDHCAYFYNEAGTLVAGIGTSNGYALWVNVATGYAQRSDNSSFWSVTSDRRLKTGIVPLTGALDVVGQLNPVRYHYTEEHRAKMGGQADKEHYGVIAQEYQKLFPEFVTTGADGYLSMQGDPLIFVATAAIKELHAKHDAALAAKDAEIAALRKQLADNDARDKAIEARLARLEQASPGTAPAVQKASLQTAGTQTK